MRLTIVSILQAGIAVVETLSESARSTSKSHLSYFTSLISSKGVMYVDF